MLETWSTEAAALNRRGVASQAQLAHARSQGRSGRLLDQDLAEGRVACVAGQIGEDQAGVVWVRRRATRVRDALVSPRLAWARGPLRPIHQRGGEHGPATYYLKVSNSPKLLVPHAMYSRCIAQRVHQLFWIEGTFIGVAVFHDQP